MPFLVFPGDCHPEGGTHALRSQARFAQGRATEGSIQLLVLRPKLRILRRLRMTSHLDRARDVRNSPPSLGEVDLTRANNSVATDIGSVVTDDRGLCYLVRK